MLCIFHCYLNFWRCCADRLLEDAQTDLYYQSWYNKIQAALMHCCGRTLRQELEHETQLVSELVQVADRVRTADKSRRKVCIHVCSHLMAHYPLLCVTVTVQV